MAGTYPAHKVEFAPGIDSSVVPAGGDWVELTSQVFEWATKFGTEDEFTQPGAGTADLWLDNSDGDFDPDNTTGPYYGDLQPFMWFRILAGTTTANTDVFYAQVDLNGFQVGASQYADSVVKVHLVDWSEALANADLPASVYEVEIGDDAPALWWRLGETDGTQASDASGNGRHGTYEGSATENSTEGIILVDDDKAIAFDGVDDVVFATGWYTLGNTFSIEFWIRAEPQPGRPAVVCLIAEGGSGGIVIGEEVSSGGHISYRYWSGGSGLTCEYESTIDVFDGERHHVVITQSGATTNLYVDSFENKTLEFGSPTNITWGAMHAAVGSDDHFEGTRHVGGQGAFLAATIDEFAIYPTALSSGRVLDHFLEGLAAWALDYTSERVTRILDLVDHPASQRNINQGQSQMLPAQLGGNAWATLVDIAKAENGVVYIDHQDAGKLRFIDRRHRWEAAASLTAQVTIGDGGGAQVPAAAIDLADDRIINYAVMQREGGAEVVVEDTTSQATYRRRSLSETGLQYLYDSESQDRAERIIAEKKDRHRRVRSVTLEPRKSTHPAWNQVFARKINDRVEVKWQPPYGGLRRYAAWIIGIAHRWHHQSGLRTTFWLAPVPFDTEPDDAPYWIAGTSLAGVDTRPGY